MSELLVAALKIGFLVLLWLFVLLAANVIRTDLFGHAVAPADVPQTINEKPTTTPRRRNKRRAKGRPRALMIAEGRQLGLEIPLDTDVTIGRSADSTLILDDDYCSTNHAAVRHDSTGGFYVEDLGSTNGTHINGTRITTPTAMGLGDELRIGRTIMKMVV